MATKRIKLTRGQVATVDEADYDWLAQYKWFAHYARKQNCFYAARHTNGRTIAMHQLLLPCKAGQTVDHANRDTLDNRRRNLRPATRSQQMQNRECWNARGVKGVFQQRSGAWAAHIKLEGKRKYLGTFQTLIEAGQAYDAAARKFFGEFARPNFT